MLLRLWTSEQDETWLLLMGTVILQKQNCFLFQDSCMVWYCASLRGGAVQLKGPQKCTRISSHPILGVSFLLPFLTHFVVIRFIWPWSAAVFGDRLPWHLCSFAFWHYLLIKGSCVHMGTSVGLLNCETSLQQCLMYIDIFSLLYDTCLRSGASFGSAGLQMLSSRELKTRNTPCFLQSFGVCAWGCSQGLGTYFV